MACPKPNFNPFGRRVQMANAGNPFGGRNVFRQNPTQGWTARAMRSPTVVPPRPTAINPNRTVTKQTTSGACCAACAESASKKK